MENTPSIEVITEKEVSAREVERLTMELDRAVRKAIASGLQVTLAAFNLGYREMLVCQVTEVKYFTQRLYGPPESRNILVTDPDDEAGPEGPEQVEHVSDGDPFKTLVDNAYELDEKSHRLK